MIVRTQDETAIYDLDKLVSVYAYDDKEENKAKVLALSYASNVAYPLGVYRNMERAKEVVGEIFALSHSQHLYEMPIV